MDRNILVRTRCQRLNVLKRGKYTANANNERLRQAIANDRKMQYATTGCYELI